MAPRQARSMRRLVAAGLIGAASTAGCGDSTPVAAPRPGALPAPAPAAAPSSVTGPSRPADPDGADAVRPASVPLPPLSHDLAGRRDPFASGAAPASGAGASSGAALKLTGVIHGAHPLALLEAPDGIGYIVKPGDALGDGRVLDVTAVSVTIALAPRGQRPPETITLTLAGD